MYRYAQSRKIPKIKNHAKQIHAKQIHDLIIEFKNERKQGIDWAYRILNRILSDQKFILTCVPGHSASKSSSGMKKVISDLTHNSNRINGSTIFHRHKTIEKRTHQYSDRSIGVHLDSIRLQNINDYPRIPVLILDDVETTGNSLAACVDFLQQEGFSQVKTLVLGKTLKSTEAYQVYSI